MKRFFMVMAGCLAQLGLLAQEEGKKSRVDFGMEYTTEMQSDFKDVNWVNQLHLSAQARLCRGLKLELGTYSVARTRDERLAADLQVFSNIEDENLPLALSVLGLQWSSGDEDDVSRTEVFAGVRNMNEDYFTSPLTSLFTNSSCGIFPTISACYDIANYPLASLGIDFKQHWHEWMFQASVYNGQGYNGFSKGDNPFILRPGKDGVFGIAAAGCDRGGSHYELGCAMHVAHGRAGSAPWLAIEQSLTGRLHLLAQGSVNCSRGVECRHYEAMGLVARIGRTASGIVLNHAAFSDAHEYAAEVTSQVEVTQAVTLQPTVHLIRTGDETSCIAMLRLTCTL